MRFDEYDFAKPYIWENETVLWQGKPTKKLRIAGPDVITVCFGLFWCGLLTYGVFDTKEIASNLASMLVYIFMFSVGFIFTIGKVFHHKFVLRHTAYVITNKKIIRRRKNKIDTLDGINMPEMRVHARTDGSGTIRFGYAETGRRSRRGGIVITVSGENSTPGIFELENIPEVAKVQHIISEMRHSVAFTNVGGQ